MAESSREVVCTLFEGSYATGVAALVNSLVAAGYNGKVYIGYRGALERWAAEIERQGGYVRSQASEVILRFVPLETEAHLTNYKPEFILHVMETVEPQALGAIYFDPDITVRCKWEFFRQWFEFGMMFCEDVNSPIHATHPRRMMWRKLFSDLIVEANASDTYINGGFVGIRRSELDFLRTWSEVIKRAAPFTGGTAGWYVNRQLDPFSPFASFDQDALNVALMSSSAPVSIVGPEGMDFKSGGFIMSHAIGPVKPWKGSFFRRALVGRAPSLADRFFVKYLSAGPLRPVGKVRMTVLYFDLLFAKIISKVIRSG